MSQLNQQINLHGNLIGGCAPCLDAVPEDIIAYHCETILGTREVHLGFCVEEHRVYFLCVPSRALEPGVEPITPLLQALPHHPRHQGDGIYRISQLGQSHIVVKEGPQFRFLSNLDEVIDDYITSINLPVFALTAEGADPLYKLSDLYREAVEKLNRPLQWIAVAGILLTTLVTGAAKLYEATRIEIPDYVTPAVKRAEALSQDLKTTQPWLKNLSRFDQLSAITIRAGGWIEIYRVDANGQESFRLMLPEWVSRDYIEALGPGVITEKTEDGLIQAVKGDVKP